MMMQLLELGCVVFCMMEAEAEELLVGIFMILFCAGC